MEINWYGVTAGAGVKAVLSNHPITTTIMEINIDDYPDGYYVTTIQVQIHQIMTKLMPSFMPETPSKKMMTLLNVELQCIRQDFLHLHIFNASLKIT